MRHLKGYYLGYLNFDCPPIWSADKSRSMQGFSETDSSTADVPTYQCYIPSTGCHYDNDCHYGPGVYCRCEGDTCFKDDYRTLNTGEKRKYVVANKDYWNYWGGCKLDFFYCYCWNDDLYGWRSIWEQDQDRADNGEMLHNFHSMAGILRTARSGSSLPKIKSSKEEL